MGFDLPNRRSSGQFDCSWLWSKWEMGLLLQELAEGKTRSVYHIEACCCTHFYMQQFVSLSCICNWAPWMCLQIKTISTLMSEQKLLNSIWKILSLKKKKLLVKASFCVFCNKHEISCFLWPGLLNLLSECTYEMVVGFFELSFMLFVFFSHCAAN